MTLALDERQGVPVCAGYRFYNTLYILYLSHKQQSLCHHFCYRTYVRVSESSNLQTLLTLKD
jgi:hypothetical protein